MTKGEEKHKIKTLKRGTVIVLVALAVFGSFYLYKIKAQTSYSEPRGAGWIKFSAEPYGTQTTGSAIPYGVYIHDDGVISGAAWSSNYGWLSFNGSDLAGCPAVPCEARMNLTTYEVSGWGKFLGIDQWVHLRGAAQDGSSYGVSFSPSTNEFAGQAWGSNLVGWISFSNPAGATITYAVSGEKINQPPLVSNVSISEPADNWCLETPSYLVAWNYSDLENADQTQVEIQWAKSSDGSVSMNASSTQLDKTYRFSDPLGYNVSGSYNTAGFLNAETSYKVRVRASDGNFWSNWTESAGTVATQPRYYPYIQSFSWTPTPATRATRETFSATVSNRSTLSLSYNWTFANSDTVNSTEVSPTVIFSSLPADVTLAVSDSGGLGCSLSQTVTTVSRPIDPTKLKRRIFRER